MHFVLYTRNVCPFLTAVYVVFLLRAVSSRRRFQWMWFPVINYPPFLLHAVSISFVSHTVSFTRSFHHCSLMPAGHFGHKTLRHHKIGAEVLRRITGGAVSSELSWVEVSRLFVNHGTRVEVSRTTFLGAEVPWDQCRSVPECLDAEVSGNDSYYADWSGRFHYLRFQRFCAILICRPE